MIPRPPQMPFPQNWDDGAQVALHAVAMMRVSAAVMPFASVPLVAEPKQVAPARSQNDQSAILREFSDLPYEIRWGCLIASLIWGLVALAIMNHYRVESELHLKLFDWKLILTPTK